MENFWSFSSLEKSEKNFLAVNMVKGNNFRDLIFSMHSDSMYSDIFDKVG